MKRGKGIKMLGWIGIGIVSVIAGVGIWFVAISRGTVEPIVDEEGNVVANSISTKEIIELNGAKNGIVIQGRDLNNPVLLFVSSGPGTSDVFFNEAYPDMHLEDEYTVCYWDYRGMCMVYDKNIDPESITRDVLMEDTHAMTQYLKERFHKEKIYIMGFSGGSRIAIEASQLYPEDYYADIGMSQLVTSGVENDTLVYDFMKKTFEERKDNRRLKKLETLVVHNEDGSVKAKEWAPFVALLHEAGGGTTLNQSEFEGIVIPLLTSHCYTVKEKLDYVPGMKMYRKTAFTRESKEIDYRETIAESEIPMYFISGEYDYNAPWPLVQDYYEKLTAPNKKFYLIPNSAHSPLWEQAEETHKAMIEIKNETLE